MKIRIMLDLETLGTSPGAAILAVGAVKFTGYQLFSEFYQRIDLQSSVEAGFTLEAQTVMWWLRQPDGPRLEILKQGDPVELVLKSFQKWLFGLLGEYPESEIEMWGNGAAFDNVLLSTAFRNCKLEQPWAFWNDRCYRTVKNLFPEIPLLRNGTHHNALDDARDQAMHLMTMLPSL